jgi:ABC-type phosphate transport system substrate-binding protein
MGDPFGRRGVAQPTLGSVCMNAARRAGMKLVAIAAAILTTIGLGITAPAQSAFAAAIAPISGAGSTWSAPAIKAWIASVAQAGLHVSYNATGSSAGRSLFAAGKVDWAAAEIPYGTRDANRPNLPPARGHTYLPDTAGATAFIYNLAIGGHRITDLRLSGAVIAGIFTDKITRWNDPRIAADNPGLRLPATAIVPVVRTDSSGATAELTRWMMATQGASWAAYCRAAGHRAVGPRPCSQASSYPVRAGTAMIGRPGALGVSGYVSQAGVNGAIGYTEYSAALRTGLPVAKVLNAAGYYTAPTPGHVGVSLFKARVNMNRGDPLYLTADLSRVFTDPDPRTYELSYYSYLIVPTTRQDGFSSRKGATLGAFGEYALCQGQRQVDALGYAALPVNVVEAGFAQLRKIPGASVPATTKAIFASCDNPTFARDGTNTLAKSDPMPPACDKRGATQCITGAVATTTKMTASPSPAIVGQAVALTATVVPAQGTTTPAGSVQFLVGGSVIGTPVAVNSRGVAMTITTFAAAGKQALSAVFKPANVAAFRPSTGMITLTVSAPPPHSVTELLTVTVPVAGSFSLTVNSAGPVIMTVSGSNATGALIPVVVSDTRNTFPGWSVTGQAGDFTSPASHPVGTIPGSQLGWAPTGTSLAQGAVLGGPVAPGAPGLGVTGAILAAATAGGGAGISTLGASLTLIIPPDTPSGRYAGALTLTAVTAAP